jgi:hypothetical protein
MNFELIEQELKRHKEFLLHRQNTAKNGTQRAAITAMAFMEFRDTFAIFQQYGGPELDAVIERVRDHR